MVGGPGNVAQLVEPAYHARGSGWDLQHPKMLINMIAGDPVRGRAPAWHAQDLDSALSTANKQKPLVYSSTLLP